MPLAGSTFAHNVHYPSGSMSEFRLVTRGQHLKFQNRVLVKRRRRPAVDPVVVGHAVNQINGVPASLPKHGHSVVRPFVHAPIDSNARNDLHQVEVVPAVQRQDRNLLRQDRCARR